MIAAENDHEDEEAAWFEDEINRHETEWASRYEAEAEDGLDEPAAGLPWFALDFTLVFDGSNYVHLSSSPQRRLRGCSP